MKEKPEDESKLGFGRIFTDYMFMMKRDGQRGWYQAAIEPYGNLSLSPAATVLHYSQEVFEGMKAYRAEGRQSAHVPALGQYQAAGDFGGARLHGALDGEFVLNSLYELIKLEKDWIPTSPNTSLYIRPTYIGVDPFVGVRPAEEYLLYIILSPSGAYYASGLAPVDIYVESKYVRAVKGGTGHHKTGGNYAASLLAGEIAHKKGYGQVLWLDGKENKYVEEVGAMNIFFKINGELVTPPLGGSILPGITRDSIITLARDMGIPVSERPIAIDELYEASKTGALEEIFGAGTAAVVSPVGKLLWEDKEIIPGDGQMGQTTKLMYDTLTGIQYGRLEDKFGWVKEVK